MQPRCQKLLCFVLKVPETGERGTERQSHANFTGHFPGNKSGSFKANKTHTYTCKRPCKMQAVCAWPSSCTTPLSHPDASDVSHVGSLSYKHVEKETFHTQQSSPANTPCPCQHAAVVSAACWEPGRCFTKGHWQARRLMQKTWTVILKKQNTPFQAIFVTRLRTEPLLQLRLVLGGLLGWEHSSSVLSGTQTAALLPTSLFQD